MTKEEKQTGQIIMEAARKVFQKSGLGGARMQQIADEAGINKASLHYYYRSKDKLFQAVFQEDFQRFMIPLSGILFRETELTVEERITTFVRSFLRTLIDNPHLPLFVIHELNRNPDRLLEMVQRGSAVTGEGDGLDYNKTEPDLIIRQIRDGIEKGQYHKVIPEQFVISIIGMCVYPSIARPIIRHWLRKDDDQYNEFLKERESEVIDYAFRILIKDYKPYEHPFNGYKRS